MSTTDTDVSQLVINKLTKQQYEGITTPSPTELYFVDDGETYVTMSDVMTGATSGAAGAVGLVPQPAAGDDAKYLKGDGTWGAIPSANNINSTDWNGLWQ